MKKISVIIPCYNVASYIDRCIMSITVQTIGINELEIICIDDASTDNTWECLQKWEQAFPDNILLIRQEVNLRQGAARNLGLQYASADWVAFVDADDWLEPDYFGQLYAPVMRLYGKERYDVVVCGMAPDCSESISYLKEEDRDCGKDQDIRSDTKEKKRELFLCKGLNVFAWAKIIRRELLLEHQISFPEGLVFEDNYWHPLLHLYAERIYVIGKKLYHYFMRASSVTHVRNKEHYLDRITVQMMKWEDYGKRGLLQVYREELEYDLLFHAVCFMRTLVFHYDQPPFSYYQLQREVIRERIPDYVMDSYSGVFLDMDAVCFDAIRHTLNKSEFQAFVDKVREMDITA